MGQQKEIIDQQLTERAVELEAKISDDVMG
jgi:hypothetical protein